MSIDDTSVSSVMWFEFLVFNLSKYLGVDHSFFLFPPFFSFFFLYLFFFLFCFFIFFFVSLFLSLYVIIILFYLFFCYFSLSFFLFCLIFIRIVYKMNTSTVFSKLWFVSPLLTNVLNNTFLLNILFL